MCGMKLVDRENANEFLKVFCVAVPTDTMVRVAAARWYEHILRKEEAAS